MRGSSKLSRESPISNPFPEELTKGDFKGSPPPSPLRGGKNARPRAGHDINHHCPQPQNEASELFGHRPLTAPSWSFPQGLMGGNSSVALRAASVVL